MPRITILGTHHPDAMALLEARPDIDTTVVEDALAPREEVEAATRGTDALAVRVQKIDAPLLEMAPDIRIVSRHGVGTDSVDVAWMSERGKPVAIAVGGNDRSVAEHTLGMMISLARDFDRLTTATRESDWGVRKDLKSYDLDERTVLIIGHGRIGSRVSQLAQTFGMKVLVADPYINAPEGVEAVSLADGLGRADIVTVHCPKNPETVDLIGADELEKMRPGTILINNARGGIVNEAACAEALHSGHLRAYGCDVFSEEPAGQDNPILHAPNTILTPHSAAWSPQSMRRMAMLSIQNVIDCFDGKLKPEMVFNRKELGL